MSNARTEFLLELKNFKGSVGLEIGPLNKPLVKKEELENNGEIFYLDHLSTEELQEKYKDEASVKTDEIVSVDFVCRDGDICPNPCRRIRICLGQRGPRLGKDAAQVWFWKIC